MSTMPCTHKESHTTVSPEAPAPHLCLPHPRSHSDALPHRSTPRSLHAVQQALLCSAASHSHYPLGSLLQGVRMHKSSSWGLGLLSLTPALEGHSPAGLNNHSCEIGVRTEEAMLHICTGVQRAQRKGETPAETGRGQGSGSEHKILHLGCLMREGKSVQGKRKQGSATVSNSSQSAEK